MGAEKETGNWEVVRALGDTTGDFKGSQRSSEAPSLEWDQPCPRAKHLDSAPGGRGGSRGGGLSAAVSELLDLGRFPDCLEMGRAHCLEQSKARDD